MYAITRKIGGDGYAIVGPQGRFEFSADDGPIITELLDMEFPECSAGCEDRAGVCEDCGECEQCADGTCTTCAETCDDCGDPVDECSCDEDADAPAAEVTL